MNFAPFVVNPSVFLNCQLLAVGFRGFRPKVVSGVLTELRKKDHGDQRLRCQKTEKSVPGGTVTAEF